MPATSPRPRPRLLASIVARAHIVRLRRTVWIVVFDGQDVGRARSLDAATRLANRHAATVQ